jgi:hypothetical protein
MFVRSISSIFASSDTFLRVYSNVISVSAVTFPTSLVSKERSSDKLIGFSFLNYNPLCNFTFAITFDAITGYDKIFEKFFVKSTGSTLSTSPPVIAASLLNESKLHSSPVIDTILTVTP